MFNQKHLSGLVNDFLWESELKWYFGEDTKWAVVLKTFGGIVWYGVHLLLKVKQASLLKAF